MQAGKLDHLMAFDAPVVTTDGMGGHQAGWDERFIAWAGVRHLRGGEAVMAARLASRQPVVVTLRASAAAAAIGTDWRLRDTRTGTAFNIRTIVPSDDRAMIEITAESGVAT